MTGGSLMRSVERDWVRLSLIAWLCIAIYFVHDRWVGIHYLQLGDTDDNMRLMQVRAWLSGQGWYDLRQYRLNPPSGYDIHWTRIVDLPIAGLIVLLRPFVGAREAEMLACGIAPLLPLSIAILGLGATVRRLVSPYAWPLAIALLLCCSATLLMYMPERIDHHGWQLAMLSLTVAGLSDPKGIRGGAIVGLASAVSLAIGLEMLPYAAIAGAILALRWIWDRAEAQRLSIYALCLGAGSGLGFGGDAGVSIVSTVGGNGRKLRQFGSDRTCRFLLERPSRRAVHTGHLLPALCTAVSRSFTRSSIVSSLLSPAVSVPRSSSASCWSGSLRTRASA